MARKHDTLRKLEAIKEKAWNAMMNSSDEYNYTIYGKVGKFELAWRAAADDCRDYREANNLLRLDWIEIEKLEIDN